MNAAVGILVALAAQPSEGDRIIRLKMRPSGQPQIAVWLENDQGTFVDTLMVTSLTGTYGLGNRPGRPDFGGAFRWPYGRREMVLPVWAHRRGVEYPRLVFQDCREDSLGWHERHSSVERFYCRPLTRREQADQVERVESSGVDAITCPTSRFSSDKGIPMAEVDRSNPLCDQLFERYPSPTTYYPPRNDLVQVDPSRDWSGAEQMRGWNDLDAVSEATPPSGELFDREWWLPAGLAEGEYTVWVEVNHAFDPNEHHDYDFFVDPMLQDYGVRVMGQPSVLWRIPIRIDPEGSSARVNEHAGYGSPDGQDGMMRPRDGTITTGVEGTGAGRLLPIQGDGGVYQVEVSVRTRTATDTACTPAAPPMDARVVSADWRGVDLLVDLPPRTDDVAYRVKFAPGHGTIPDAAAFAAAQPLTTLTPSATSTAIALRLDLPRPQAPYTVGIQPIDTCQRPGGGRSDGARFMTVDVSTAVRQFRSLDACFVATAAHGARYAEEVATLRHFRDEVLVPSDAGLAAVELYYYVSPSLAEAIRDDSTLRAAARFALKPLVWLADAL